MAKATTKAAAKPATKAKKPAAPKKAPAAATKGKAPAKPKAPKAAKPEKKSVIKQTSDAISQLASDILHDRIEPTIEQIKSLAASALGQDETKGKRTKPTKKK